MKTFKINTQFLRALLPLAADKDIRYYLNGVCIEISPERTRYMASDGSALGILTQECVNDVDAVLRVIVPREIVKQVKVNKSLPVGILEILDETHARIVDDILDQDIGFKPVEGRFPDIDRVVPSKVSGEAGHFDFDLLAKFREVNRLLGAGKPGLCVLRQNGPTGAALVELQRPEFKGVVMPMGS